MFSTHSFPHLILQGAQGTVFSAWVLIWPLFSPLNELSFVSLLECQKRPGFGSHSSPSHYSALQKYPSLLILPAALIPLGP